MSRASCERWARSVDRMTAGEPLSAEEQVFVAQHPLACARCGAEARAFAAFAEPVPSVAQRPLSHEEREAADDWLARFDARAVTAPGVIDLAVRRRARVRMVALVAAACLVVAFGALLTRGLGDTLAPDSTREDAAPVVAWLLDTPAAAGVGAEVRRGQPITTGAEARCLRLSGRHRVCLGPGAEARVMQMDDRRRLISLRRGEAAFEVQPITTGAPFEVSFALGQVVVLGTVFAVTLAPEGETAWVSLLEGRVRVIERGGRTHDLEAGRSMQLGASGDAPLTAEDLGRALGLLGRAAAAEPGRPAPDAQDSGRAAPAVSDTPAPPAPQRRPRAARGEGKRPPRGAHQESRDTARRGGAPGMTGATPAGASDAAGPGALLQQAQVARAEGRNGEAVQLYRRLQRLHPESPEARTSLVSLGELELSKLSRPAVALRAFQRYLDSGDQSLAREALYGKIRALAALGRRPEERHAIEAYLRLYPSGLQSDALRRRLQTVD